MKTKEEVIEYLKENGHTPACLNRILGFLVGDGVKEFDEKIIIKYGDLTWDDFYEWWESESEEEVAQKMCDLLNYLQEQHDKAKTDEEKDKMNGFIVFLADNFCTVDYENDEESA